jgi:hypothetical protein
MGCMVYWNKCDVGAHIIHCAIEHWVCCNKFDVCAHGCMLCLWHESLITYHALYYTMCFDWVWHGGRREQRRLATLGGHGGSRSGMRRRWRKPWCGTLGWRVAGEVRAACDRRGEGRQRVGNLWAAWKLPLGISWIWFMFSILGLHLSIFQGNLTPSRHHGSRRVHSFDLFRRKQEFS